MKQKHSKAQQILAIIGIALIIALYAAALICAFIDHPLATSILWSAIFSTVVIPVIIFAFRFFIGSSRKDESEE